MSAAGLSNLWYCSSELPKKHRRVIFGDSFGVFSQLTQIIDHVAIPSDGLSRYVCGFCFMKLNKLRKINVDLVTKLDALRREKTELESLLWEKHKQSGIQKTPTGKKRMIIHSPTPRKSKKSFLVYNLNERKCYWTRTDGWPFRRAPLIPRSWRWPLLNMLNLHAAPGYICRG